MFYWKAYDSLDWEHFKRYPFHDYGIQGKQLNSCHFTMSLLDEKFRHVAIFGGNIVWRGVAEVFVLTNVLARPIVVKYARMLMDSSAMVYKLNRMQCVVEVSQPKFCRFAEAVGFEQESIMRDASPDAEDLAMYVRRYRHGVIQRSGPRADAGS